MFYSETLLSRTGPLAQVWLAANREKKLNKNHILKENIQDDVNEIIDERQAPMALRLSAQLLVGLVRIYSRKAHYLWDDCNEALLRLKNWLKPGNVDLPSTQARTANPASLILPETLTEMDMFAPLPDPDVLLREFETAELAPQDTTIAAWDDSQLLPGSQSQEAEERRRRAESAVLEEGLDLGLDIGEETEVPGDTSIERFREAPAARRASEEFGEASKGGLEDDLDLGLDIGEDTLLPPVEAPAPEEEDTVMAEPEPEPIEEEPTITEPAATETAFPEPFEEIAAPPERQRESLSPLSSVRSSMERELAQELNINTSVFEPTEEQPVQARQAKRRKLLHPDADTELHSSQIRAQQEDRSKILKPTTFLPRDPLLLALMNMQKSGGFVSSILGDGLSRGWAPELRGILSLEVVRKSGDLKRKRDRGIVEAEEPEAAIEIPEGEETALPSVQFEESALPGAEEIQELPTAVSERILSSPRQESEEAMSPAGDNFDETTAPLLHPAEAGPVSVGTKHAVHILRDLFGPECAESAEQRRKTTCVFQDILPERTTTRAEATKMFFEVLVLSTKDAIKVDQPGNQFGGPIRIRSKRALWGDWAEMGADAGADGEQQEAGEEQALEGAAAPTVEA